MRARTIRKILLVAAGSVFLFSSSMVLKHRLEMRAGAEQSEVVAQMAVVPSAEQPENIIEEETVDETVEIAPIQVNFDALRAKNQDVIAWLYCPDTPINYPVVQASDNEFYLHRLLDGSKNPGGTLFMDYRNAADLSDWNSVIYGHNMINDSMFGSLTDYQAQSYFEAHPQMFLLTPEKDYKVEIVAGCRTSANSEVYSTFIPNEEEKVRLMERWLDASDFVSGYDLAAEDRLLTLSTCSYEDSDARYVLIGSLKELDAAQK